MDYTLTTENNRTIITLWGRFDSQKRHEFLSAFQLALEEDTKEIVIDLQKVMFIDSTAVGLLMVAHQKCETPHKGLSLCVADGPVKQTLDFLKITDIIPVTPSQ
ncbi:STAS domain-containing protein [Nitrospira sp. M1]